VANHRADTSAATTPRVRPPDAVTVGKRKAVKPSRAVRRQLQREAGPGRFPLLPWAPSTPTVVGAAALVLAAVGAVGLGQEALRSPAAAESTRTGAIQRVPAQPNVLSGVSRVASSDALASREKAVSRDSQREALEDAAEQQLQAAAEAQAKERNAALAQLAASAEKHAAKIAANRWVLPVSDYRLSAHFGQSSSLWSSTHTGLDFAAPSGTPVMSLANGVVTSTEYAGAYGNRVIVTLEDGTEIWFCHLTSFAVNAGDTVSGGQVVGYVGSTGNSTGPHLHLEVRPGAGDPVDPHAALRARGLTP